MITKKKILFSMAAATTLLFANPLFNKADAASNCPTYKVVNQVQHYQINQNEIQGLIEKYMKDLPKNFQDLENLGKQVPAPAQPEKPAPEQPTPAPAPANLAPEKPAPAPSKPAPAPSKPAEEQPAQPAPEQSSSQLSAYEQKVVELTNAERAKNGLAALKVDPELSKVAREKSRDMQANNYFDHNSPVYGSPFDMMKQFGISYRTAGENIAMGQRTPEEVVNAWMNSEGHRKNILNANFTHIGVGHIENGNYWTQQFIGK
ncbi:sporulation protein [Bacillaceae bacterium Marseille-Q3522]|nr:sporulation protein [Bacillaceae bacterium Marseille-Q3522]